MTLMESPDVYEIAAGELVARYRDSALEIANTRVTQFADAGDWTSHRQSLMVLSAVERLIANLR
jgi:hypothetical protein